MQRRFVVWVALAAVILETAVAFFGSPLPSSQLLPASRNRGQASLNSQTRHSSGAVGLRAQSEPGWDDDDKYVRPTSPRPDQRGQSVRPSTPRPDQRGQPVRPGTQPVRPGTPSPNQKATRATSPTAFVAPRSVSPTLVDRRADSPIPTRIGLADGTYAQTGYLESIDSRSSVGTRPVGAGTYGSRKVGSQRVEGPRAVGTRRTESGSEEGGYQAPAPTISFYKPANASTFPGKGKPLLLYIPGLDGTGGTADAQFRDLSRNYDVRCMRIKPQDRTSFDSLTRTVSRYIAYFQRTASPEKAMVLGEGLGGMIALAVGLESPDLLQGIVAVNPATSFERSMLNTFLSSAPLTALGAFAETVNSSVPFLNQKIGDVLPASLDVPRPEATLTDLAFSFFSAPLMVAQTFDPFRTMRQANRTFSRVRARGRAGVAGASRGAQETIAKLVADFGMDGTKHKLDVLRRGCEWVNPRLSSMVVPVLAVAGENDRLLPSASEVMMMSKTIPTCKMQILYGAGHLPLDDPSVNITKMILDSPAASKALRYDPVLDWVPPTDKEVKDAQFQMMPFKALTSPVYFSTKEGRVFEGLGGLPDKLKGRPILFVGNHQLWGLDSSLLVSGLYDKYGMLVRGLAHPFVMQEGLLFGFSRQEHKNPLQTFGAVAVGPKNYYKLLAAGEAILLYPGGTVEAFNAKASEYPLDWPERPDFVRLAAKFNAIIVPFGGVGCSDLGLVIDLAAKANLTAAASNLNNEQRSPLAAVSNIVPMLFGGEDAMNRAMQRFGVPGINDERLTFEKPPPLFIPNPPFATPRFYYKFAEPIYTDKVNPEDKEMCMEIYQEAKASVRESIDYLLEKRKTDPYRNQVARFTYEATKQVQAPTFDP